MDVDPAREAGERQLFDLIRQVNSSTDTTQVLEEIVAGVVDKLGFGLAAIARLEGETLVVQAYAGPDSLRGQLMGRRTPQEAMEAQFRLADCWGILRYVPHDRVDDDFLENAWIPDYDPVDAPDAWHPEDALYAPLISATGELVGNMAVDFPPFGRIPSQELRDLLELFVVQAGLALSNAQQRERLAEQVRLGRIVNDIALATSLDDFEETLTRAARTVAHGFDSSQAWVSYFPEPSSSGGRRVAAYPPVEQHEQLPSLERDLRSFRQTGKVACWRLEGGRMQPAVFNGDGLEELMVRRSANTVLAVPLSAGDEVHGCLALLQSRHLPLSDGERSTLSEIARELGRLILNHHVYQRERRLVTELQQLDRYKDELIATISHELKTPLTSILGHVEILGYGEDSPNASVAAITRNAQRLNALIGELLDYARVQNERDYSRRQVDIVEVVETSLDLHHLQANALGLQCSMQTMSPATVCGDPDELGRVIDNLVGNAIKYSPDGGSVNVTISSTGGVVDIAVTDSGLGISDDDQKRLFSPFHRSRNPAALAIPGTGLGLAIARRIAVLHGGDISLESQLGVGSTFHLRLPAALSS